MSLCRRIQGACRSAARLAGLAQTPLLTAIRLYWGWQFAVTGLGKLHSLDRVTEFFGSLHLPMPGFTAAFVASVEFLGGVLLALGLGTRLVALILLVNMSVAFWVADREALFAVFSAPEKFYGADAFLFWAAALLLLIFGPGAWSMDRWLGVERLTD
ncbi:MAG: DoxX family protein [Terracidiphilus sp.]|nr:DoxX family protein [Terracidiphilus sp.]